MRLGSRDKKGFLFYWMDGGYNLGNRFVLSRGYNPSIAQGVEGPWPKTHSVESSCLGSVEIKDLRLSSFDRTFCGFVILISFGILSGFFSLVEQPESWDYKPPPGSWGIIPVFGVLVFPEPWLGPSWKPAAAETPQAALGGVSSLSRAEQQACPEPWSCLAPALCFINDTVFSRPATGSKG